jgi:hypothetical protein
MPRGKVKGTMRMWVLSVFTAAAESKGEIEAVIPQILFLG